MGVFGVSIAFCEVSIAFLRCFNIFLRIFNDFFEMFNVFLELSMTFLGGFNVSGNFNELFSGGRQGLQKGFNDFLKVSNQDVNDVLIAFLRCH